MIKTFIRIIALLLLLCGTPILFSVSAGSKKEKMSDNVLVFTGSARRHLRLDDSINAALIDAARKVAFFHSVSGKVVAHESNGVLVGDTFVTSLEIKDSDDYMRYLDKLEYNREIDVFESGDAVFVRAGYRSASKINLEYRPAKNNEKPQWVDSPPPKIGSYAAAVGLSQPLLYYSDTVVASYENAVLSLIESFCTRIRRIESEIGRSNNVSSLSIASGTLTGFFVLDTWTDPTDKSVWTLAIADGFTESETY